MEAAKITWGSVVVLVSPEGRVTVEETYNDQDSDPYLRRELTIVLTTDTRAMWMASQHGLF